MGLCRSAVSTRRRTASSGALLEIVTFIVLLSTHGIYPFHPNPDDLWRWTHQGLERLFLTNAEWTSVTVRPGAGTAATLGMINAHFVDLLFKRLRIRAAATPFVFALNRVGELLDGAVPLLASTAPGTLHANYHVEAVA